jgi:hypothetical protein
LQQLDSFAYYLNSFFKFIFYKKTKLTHYPSEGSVSLRG